jgi:hypothetical protein
MSLPFAITPECYNETAWAAVPTFIESEFKTHIFIQHIAVGALLTL